MGSSEAGAAAQWAGAEMVSGAEDGLAETAVAAGLLVETHTCSAAVSGRTIGLWIAAGLGLPE